MNTPPNSVAAKNSLGHATYKNTPPSTAKWDGENCEVAR